MGEALVDYVRKGPIGYEIVGLYHTGLNQERCLMIELQPTTGGQIAQPQKSVFTIVQARNDKSYIDLLNYINVTAIPAWKRYQDELEERRLLEIQQRQREYKAKLRRENLERKRARRRAREARNAANA